MPRPISTATFRHELAVLAEEYAATASQRGFIADQLFPVFDTPLGAGQYPVIPSEAYLKLYSTKRAPRANYARSDYEFEPGTFACAEQGWEEAIDDSEANLYSSYFDLEAVANTRAVDIMLRGREKRVSDKVLSTTNLAHGAVTVAWSELAACDPRGDINTARMAVRAVTGMLPNAVSMSYATMQNILSCKAFQEATKYTSQVLLLPFEAQKNLVALYLNVDNVLVSTAVYDTAKKGQATSVGDIWDTDKVLVCTIGTNAKDLKEPCIGRTMLWTGDSPQILTAETYRAETNRGNVLRLRHNIDEVFVFAACGYIVTGVK